MPGEDPVTEAIVSAVADAGLNESPDADPADPSGTVDPSPDPAAPDKAGKETASPEPDEETELTALEQELLGKEPKLKHGKISVSRHQAVLTRTRRQHDAKIAEADKRFAALADYEKPEWALKRDALKLAEMRPDLYLDLLLEDPRYKSEFEKRSKAVAPPPAPVVPVVEDLEPEPDKLYEDGTVGYTVAAAKALSAWQMRQAEKKFEDRLKDVRKDYEPIVAERRQEAMFQASVKKMEAQIAKARETWEGFSEHEKEVEAHFLADPSRTLYESYIATVIPKMKANRETVRAEERAAVIKEWNEKSTPPSRPAPGSRPEASADPDKPRDLEDIIREASRKIPA
jgi:hypothetical protein